MKRIFLIVLDSVGIGEMPDAADYGDAGSNTLRSASSWPGFQMPNMKKLGLFSIDGVDCQPAEEKPQGAFARLAEVSKGKDTTIGHWEIAGLASLKMLPVFPNGFPQALLDELKQATGREILCNQPYSGTKVIEDYGAEHMKTGALIVYTSADSVLQIAAHEEIVPLQQLYQYCEMARKICSGNWGVGRVIARPFNGAPGSFVRTSGRHDYSLTPPGTTMLDQICEAGKSVLSVGKIEDIFGGRGITRGVRTSSNQEGIDRTLERMAESFEGLCFTNLVDYDMLYGHRNDIEGYAKALMYFDERLPELLAALKDEDILMITADHGCDPATPSTDHSREYVPLVMAGKSICAGCNLGTRMSFADIGATILDYLGIESRISGTSFLSEIIRENSSQGTGE
ncbi:MAG: phosphopentomutase [Lachnospiraceae bacterium]|nr:phosphopentomutase [Lachnospiraceae bacterium]